MGRISQIRNTSNANVNPMVLNPAEESPSGGGMKHMPDKTATVIARPTIRLMFMALTRFIKEVIL
jgi:hypothetical protein